MSRTQEQINQHVFANYAGIDVSKASLDFAVYRKDIHLSVPNDRRGIQKLTRERVVHNVELVVIEPSGKFHRPLHAQLHDAEINVAVVNPFRSRQFADSLGQLAKTDKIDARILARYAAVINPTPNEPISETGKELQELQTARRQLVDEIGNPKRRLKACDLDLVRKQIRTRLKLAQSQKKIVEAALQQLILSDHELTSKFKILTSIPNIGVTTAALLLADLSELGHVNCRQIAALAGVAPMNWDSGSRQGTRVTRGGRPHVRKALYMCAVSGINRRGAYGAAYQRLIQKGKPPKVALTAIMRKLIVLANTLISEHRRWEPRTM